MGEGESGGEREGGEGGGGGMVGMGGEYASVLVTFPSPPPLSIPPSACARWTVPSCRLPVQSHSSALRAG